MYIKQAFKIENDWWLYIVGFLIVVVGIVLGQIPLTIAIVMESLGNDSVAAIDDPYELMGILDSNLNLFLMLIDLCRRLGSSVFYCESDTQTKLGQFNHFKRKN